jgi:hypothetical protein
MKASPWIGCEVEAHGDVVVAAGLRAMGMVTMAEAGA